MPRPQFSLKTLLWLMVVVGAFLGGMAVDRQILKRRGAMILVPAPSGSGRWVDIVEP
jgi:hypothetical protein